MNSYIKTIDPPSKSINDRRALEQDDDTIDIFALLNVIWRGKWIIIAATLVFTLIGIYQAFVVSVPVYRATAVVILETDQASPIDLQGVVGGLSGDSTEVKSEIEVLRA